MGFITVDNNKENVTITSCLSKPMNRIQRIAAVGSLITTSGFATGCQNERIGQQVEPQVFVCTQVPLPGEKELTAKAEVEAYCNGHREGVLSCLASPGFPNELTVGFGEVACNNPGLSKILDHLYSDANKVSHSCVTGGRPHSKSCSELKITIK
jgi:hypothetical protein